MRKIRNNQLDILKGIGILIVIIGHVSRNGILNNWIYSFHMPLFFSYQEYCITYQVR